MEDSTGQQPKQKQAFLDKFFITTTASGLLGGTVSTMFLCYSWSLVPIVPAIFFGLGISSLVYHFMGGIKPDTKIKVGAVTLTGTLGSLVATIFILNSVLENQIAARIEGSSLLVNPEENSLLALNKTSGEAVKVSIGMDNILKNIDKTIALPHQSDLEKIKELCRDGEGFCKEERDAIFEIDELVPLGQAKMCHGQAIKYLGYPLFLEVYPKNRIQRVIVSSEDNCINPPNQPITIKINPSDAKVILGESKRGQGKARIASLRALPVTSQGNIAQQKSFNAPTSYSFVPNY